MQSHLNATGSSRGNSRSWLMKMWKDLKGCHRLVRWRFTIWHLHVENRLPRTYYHEHSTGASRWYLLLFSKQFYSEQRQTPRGEPVASESTRMPPPPVSSRKSPFRRNTCRMRGPRKQLKPPFQRPRMATRQHEQGGAVAKSSTRRAYLSTILRKTT